MQEYCLLLGKNYCIEIDLEKTGTGEIVRIIYTIPIFILIKKDTLKKLDFFKDIL